MATTPANIGHDLSDVPFSDMIRELGMAISQAQFALDLSSARQALLMSGSKWTAGEEGNPFGGPEQDPIKLKFGKEEYSLMELGFTPTFYQFVDTIIEVKMSISMQKSEQSQESRTNVAGGLRGGFFGLFGGGGLKVTTVSASFASKYQYSAEGSSLIRTKLVPVPPPAVLQERLRRMVGEKSD